MTTLAMSSNEAQLMDRLKDGRRIHVVMPERQAALRSLVSRGYARIVAEEHGLLIAEPTARVPIRERWHESPGVA